MTAIFMSKLLDFSERKDGEHAWEPDSFLANFYWANQIPVNQSASWLPIMTAAF
jgi:hypothetical protein